MSGIKKYITEINHRNEKVLSVFLTGGFPDKNNFPALALKILESGADMLEIGFPFSDPLADGPVIQQSSKAALDNGINLEMIFEYVAKIKQETDKPVILMGYANPVLSYGIENFANSCKDTGVDGVIIPDIPLEEYEDFYCDKFNGIDKILLISPTTTKNRVKQIDEKSSGFVYCVSISGTTGARDSSNNLQYIKNSGSLLTRNNMLVGFGIGNGEDAKRYSEFSDGVIVGSAVIKSLGNDNGSYKKTLTLIKEIKKSI